jgi:hypothetical protein
MRAITFQAADHRMTSFTSAHGALKTILSSGFQLELATHNKKNTKTPPRQQYSKATIVILYNTSQ